MVKKLKYKGLNNLPKVTQLVCSDIGMKTRQSDFRACTLIITLFCPPDGPICVNIHCKVTQMTHNKLIKMLYLL